jgi:hypothetical protein
MMCIDLYGTGDDNITSSNTIYVSVFPNGIHLPAKVWSLLYAKMNNTLIDYRMPDDMRKSMRTVELYTITKEGTRTILSTEGVINSSTPFTGCSNTMQYSIDKCVNPPMKSITTSSTLSDCPNSIPTTQYKCAPFNQMTDLDKSGRNVKIGDGCLADIINSKNMILTDQNNTATVGMFSDDFVKTTLPAIAITVAVVVFFGWIAKKALDD